MHADLVAAAAATSARPQGALVIDDAVKVYGEGEGVVPVLDHCSFDVAAGEICVVVGPSGCGKTTLLKAIAGFHDLTSGSIRLDGQILCGPERPLARVGADRVVVFQNGALFPWKTNLENVAFGPIVQGTLRRAEALEKARQRMADAGLSGYEDVYPGATSSGVKRRIEIVRALMNEPTVLLLDEPFRALDALTRSVMHESLLAVYAKQNVTIFFITHDLEEAVFLGHKVVVMTSRPCRPKRIFTIDFPHPRDPGLVADPRYVELVRTIADEVEDETRLAFALGEKEGGQT